jgi:hypothetical protein
MRKMRGPGAMCLAIGWKKRPRMFNTIKLAGMTPDQKKAALVLLEDDIEYYLKEREKPGRKQSDLEAEMFMKWSAYTSETDLRNLLRLKDFLAGKA